MTECEYKNNFDSRQPGDQRETIFNNIDSLLKDKCDVKIRNAYSDFDNMKIKVISLNNTFENMFKIKISITIITIVILIVILYILFKIFNNMNFYL